MHFLGLIVKAAETLLWIFTTSNLFFILFYGSLEGLQNLVDEEEVGDKRCKVSEILQSTEILSKTRYAKN